MANRLEEYGYGFQVKAISALIHDKTFLQQIVDILSPDDFDNPSHKWIINKLTKYYNEHRTTPTMDVFRVELNTISNEVTQIAVKEQLKEIYTQTVSNDLEYVKEHFLNFCKNQTLKNALIKSIELLDNGDYDGIRSNINEALKAGTENNLGHEYLLELEDRYKEDSRGTIETPWSEFNSLLKGGLGNGDLGVLMGNPGGGKSWTLVALGGYAVKLGYTVLHYTLELSDKYVGQRYDSYFTKIPVEDLSLFKDKVKETIGDLRGNLYIKQYPANRANINTIRSHFEKCKGQGITPDIIILDYADLLHSKSYKEKRDNIGEIYTSLRGMATELNVPIWTVSQVNRSGARSDIIEGDQVSESYEKIMIADFIVSLSRKTEDKENNTGRIHIIKNRYGADGMTYNANINTSNGDIKFLDRNTEVSGSSNNNNNNISSSERRRLIQAANDHFSF